MVFGEMKPKGPSSCLEKKLKGQALKAEEMIE